MLGSHRSDELCPECLKRVALMEPEHGIGIEEEEGLADDFLPETTRRFRSGYPSFATLKDSGGERFGEYELIQSLGHGAMGEVFKARHVRLNRLVALKMIRHGGRHASEAERDRFLREAEAVARLDHPHIIVLYEAGEAAGQPCDELRCLWSVRCYALEPAVEPAQRLLEIANCRPWHADMRVPVRPGTEDTAAGYIQPREGSQHGVGKCRIGPTCR